MESRRGKRKATEAESWRKRKVDRTEMAGIVKTEKKEKVAEITRVRERKEKGCCNRK